MAEIYTRAHSINAFHTGASIEGEVQPDPNLSLGKFRAGSLVKTIEDPGVAGSGYVPFSFSGKNGEGAATIRAVSSTELAYTAPGGVEGPAVAFTAGSQSKILEDGADPAKLVWVVSDSGPVAFSGTLNVTLAYKKNTAVVLDDVTSAERTAGDTEYRCICLKNQSANSVTNLKVRLETQGTRQTTDAAQLPGGGAGTIQTSGSFSTWPSSGYARVLTSGGAQREIVYYSSRTGNTLTVPAAGRGLLGSSAAAGAAADTVDAIPGIAIGLDAPTSQPNGLFEDITGSGEGTAPAGVTFSSPTESAEALVIGTLNAGEIYGVWIKRQIPAGATSQANWFASILWDFDAI